MADKPTLSPVPLTPVSNPTVSRPMVQTERLETNPNKIHSFLSALGALQPSVAQMTTALNDRVNSPEAQRDRAARVQLQAMALGHDETGKMMRTETDPVAQKAWGVAFGQKAAIDARNRIQAMYAESEDPTSFDIQAAIAAESKKALEQFGGDASAARAYTEGMANVASVLTSNQGQQQTAKVLAARDDALTSVFGEAYGQGGVDGLKKVMKTNARFMALPADKQKELVAEQLETAAINGDPAQVAALGDIEFNGHKLSESFGSKWATLVKSADNNKAANDRDVVAPQIAKLKELAQRGAYGEAEAKQVDEFIKKYPKLASEATKLDLENTQNAAVHAQHSAAVEAGKRSAKADWFTRVGGQLADMAAKGDIQTRVPNDVELKQEDGSSVTITAKDVIEYGVEEAAKQAASFESSQVPDDQKGHVATAARTKVYANNGMLPPEVKTSAATLLKRSKVARNVSDADRAGIASLIQIKNNAPALLSEVVKSDQDQAYVDTLDSALSSGLSEDQAIEQAQIARDTFGTRAPMPRRDLDDSVSNVLSTAAKGTDGNWWAAWQNTSPTAKNNAQMRYFIEREIKLGYARGGDPADIEANALKIIQANTLNYKGNLIDLKGVSVSAGQAAPLFDTATAKLLATPGKEGLKDRGISWQRDAFAPTFHAVDSHGIPIPNTNVNLEQLQKLHGFESAKARAKAWDEAEATHQREMDELEDAKKNGRLSMAGRAPWSDKMFIKPGDKKAYKPDQASPDRFKDRSDPFWIFDWIGNRPNPKFDLGDLAFPQ